MPQSLSNILVHIIFSTKERYPFLKDSSLRAQLHAYMAGILIDENCPGILVGGIEDHTHILCQLGRTSCIADLVKNTKRSSSIWVKEMDPSLDKFAWQKGYDAFSIGQSQVEQVKSYIRHQDRHHRRVSFQDEFREFLRRYQVEFDERYVWD